MARFGIKEVAEVTFYDIATNKPVLFFDTLKMSNLDQTGQSVYAEGGRGAGRILGWDFNRQATFKMQDALLSAQSLAALAGSAVTTGLHKVRKREWLTVASGSVTIAETPLATTITAYRSVDGKIHGTELTVGTVSAKVVPLTGTGPTLVDGDKVLVYYQFNSAITAELITFSADLFPAYYTIVADGLVRNEVTGVDEPIQIEIGKAKLDPAFNMTLDASNVSVFDFNLEVFKQTNKEMIRFLKY